MVPVCEQRMLIPIHSPMTMSWRGMNNVYSPSRDPTTDQSDNTTKLQLVEPANTSVLLTGTWMTQRQPHHQKLNTAWVTTHKSWNPGDSLHGFQEAQHLGVSLLLSSSYCLFNLWEGGTCETITFQELHETCALSPPPQVLISEGIVPR